MQQRVPTNQDDCSLSPILYEPAGINPGRYWQKEEEIEGVAQDRKSDVFDHSLPPMPNWSIGISYMRSRSRACIDLSQDLDSSRGTKSDPVSWKHVQKGTTQ